jgi:hypothetical protein
VRFPRRNLVLLLVLFAGCDSPAGDAPTLPDAPDPPPPVTAPVSPPKAGNTRIRVFDGETGEPVFGAFVRVWAQKGHQSCYPRYVTRTVTGTDREGVATFDVRTGDEHLQVEAGGYCTRRFLRLAEIRDGVIRMSPGATVSGVVRGPDGGPAPKARLSAYWRGEGSEDGTTSASGWPIREDGTFRTWTLRKGRWELRARLQIGGVRHSARCLVEAGDRNVVLVLSPEAKAD